MVSATTGAQNSITPAIYRLVGVEQRYEERSVLVVPALTIYQGEVLAIVGPSGAGKSTLLRLLNFLEQPTQGNLFFDEQLVSSQLPLIQKRRVTMVFQQPILFQQSVVENLGIGLRLRRKPFLPHQQKEWLERLGLAPLGRKSARQLSAGEAQRVAIGRALLCQPDVLLLDEPTANLDPANVEMVEKLVQMAHQQHKMTIVWVTHNLHQAQRVADRVALLLNGYLREVAGNNAFFHHPQQPETQAFVQGRMIY